ncbi:protein cholesin isoform f [Homo sapiens]|uniref:protein cholesin isoform f n=1 Tax=Homo sapiens TaxID=9606 RepID=UPI00287B8A4D|nr:uncharacterized protein C7orf50 isoform f [Homo sapiens]
MYDSDKVPDEHFSTLLAYLEGLQGRARELTVQKAEALMRELDEEGSDPPLPGRAQRIRQEGLWSSPFVTQSSRGQKPCLLIPPVEFHGTLLQCTRDPPDIKKELSLGSVTRFPEI